MVQVLEQVLDAKVRILLGVEQLLGEALYAERAVVQLYLGVVHFVGVHAQLPELFVVLAVLGRRQVDVEAAEALGRGDRDGEGRVEHRRVDVLGFAADHARALPLPVLQSAHVCYLLDHLVLQRLELFVVVDRDLEQVQIDTLRSAFDKMKLNLANSFF